MLPPMIHSVANSCVPLCAPATPRTSIQALIQAGPSASVNAATNARERHCWTESNASAQGKPKPMLIQSNRQQARGRGLNPVC